uniref:Putative secreted protein n=1 Tax=Anopheles darlingi TaxID=43151 RepID=A0A2M4DMQ6_ANODA
MFLIRTGSQVGYLLLIALKLCHLFAQSHVPNDHLLRRGHHNISSIDAVHGDEGNVGPTASDNVKARIRHVRKILLR